ncbi:MAG: hypothetical protein KDD10_21330 [Phaeodactylibacter sp.]|nr:hypothetical protein [Phaeodactylibacter sp.]MCB9293000.1 MerR family transcriptional regulator [Lewinellaceae bacterium]
MSIRYITIEAFSEFHEVDAHLIEEFIQFGLLEPVEQGDQPCIREEDIEPLETLLRLHSDLDINLAGLEAIMHLRRRMLGLQTRIQELERQLRWYEKRFATHRTIPEWDHEKYR